MRKVDLFLGCIFLYFFTLHADQLGFTLGGFNIRVNNILAVLLLVMLFVRLAQHMFSIDRKLVYALLFIALSIFVSALLSPYKARCMVFTAWFALTLICYVFLPLLLVQVVPFYTLFSLYLLSFMGVGCYALCQLLFSILGLHDPLAWQWIIESRIVRPNAFAYEPSFYALYMTPFIVLCNFHFLTNREQPFFCFQKLSFSLIAFINLLFVISVSTSAIFAYLVFFCALLLIKSFRKKALKFGALLTGLLALLGVCSPFLVKTFLLKFLFSGFMSHGSFFERWVGISNAWKVFMEHPFFGVGLGGYPAHLTQAWLDGDSTYQFFAKFLIERAEDANFCKAFEPMNVLTELLASLGIVGACAFGALFYVFFRKIKQAWRIDPLLVTNLVLSTGIMLIVLQINQGLLRTYIWVHFTLVFGFLDRQRYEMHSNQLIEQPKPH